MWFWYFMLVCDLLIPLTLIIGGWLMWKKYPKKINGLVGYRTSRSMKNEDTWKFAHIYCGKLWWKLGWIILLPSLIVHFPFVHSSDNTIGALGGILVTIQCIILAATIIPTEKALKNNFNNDGSKK